MHVQLLLSAALTTGSSFLAMALPTNSPPISNSIVPRTKAMFNTFTSIDPQDKCGLSTFLQDTSDGEGPLNSDCLALAANARSNNGFFDAFDFDDSNVNNFLTLATAGTCAFGIRPRQEGVPDIRVGNTDVADLIQDAVSKFAGDETVKAWGTMGCDSADGSVWTGWRIYHS